MRTRIKKLINFYFAHDNYVIAGLLVLLVYLCINEIYFTPHIIDPLAKARTATEATKILLSENFTYMTSHLQPVTGGI